MDKEHEFLQLLSDKEFTAELIKEIQERFSEIYRKPVREGVCDDCGGRIVKHVSGFFRDQCTFSLPECERCQTPYWGAGYAHPFGVEEFIKKLNTPFTL